MFLINSRLSLFSATPSGYLSIQSFLCIPVTLPEHSFSRSYGVNLPSSLTWVLSSALGYSPHPPVSVYGTVTNQSLLEAFLGSAVSAPSTYLDSVACRASACYDNADFPALSACTLRHGLSNRAGITPCVTPSIKQLIHGTEY